jgi:hypothetical protein
MPSNHTPNYALNQWERDDRVLMDDFNADNAKIDGALGALAEVTTAHGALLSRLGNCRIETFDYVGTGTYGPNSPTILNFTARPVFFLILYGGAIYYGSGHDEKHHAYLGCYQSGHSQSFGFTYRTMQWVGNQARIVGEDEYRQMNGVNYEYRVIAFYAEDAEA